jgi:hypothetical protein
MSQESKNVQVSKKTVLTPVLDRFVDGFGLQVSAKKRKQSKRVNHPSRGNAMPDTRKSKFKVEVFPLLAWTARQVVSAAVASCTESFCFSSCFGGLLRVWVGSL